MGYENKVSVLAIKGWTVSPEILQSLFFAAQEMFSEKRDKVTFSNFYVSGTASTQWKKGGMLNVFGYLFTARLKWDNGQKECEITFVCREVDITKLTKESFSYSYGNLGWDSFNLN